MSPDFESRGEFERELRELRQELAKLKSDQARFSESLRSLQGAIAQYNQLLSQSPAIICQISSDGITLFVNQAVEEITGYSPNELLGKNWWQIFYPGELYRQVEELLKKFEKQEDVVQYLMSLQAKDGTLKHILWTSYNLWSRDGKLKEINGVGISIHSDFFQNLDIGKVLNELSKAYDSYKTILDNATIWIDILDEKGNVVFWNRAAERISGYSREEVLGHNKIWQWLYPDEEYRKEVFAKAMAIIQGEVVENLETVITTKDGKKRVISWHSNNLVDEQGRIIGSIAIGADITDLKKIEEQLRLTEKMQGLGRLAGGIAHDFNNILSVIKGYAELALSELEYNHPVREDLLEILEASERGARLTHQLLAFSRRQSLERISLDLNETIRSMVRMIQRVLGEDIELKLELEDSLPAIYADPAQIEQVIFNLIVNARDAMPEGGLITISTSLAKIDYSYIRSHPFAKPGEYVLLAVSDTGIGMTPEEKERIFEPFFTTKKDGAGFGLSTVYGIVHQHNGYIWVYSEKGSGTTFKIYLPLSGRPAQAPEKKEESPSLPRGEENILLVEDEPAVRTLAVRILRSLGYKVIEASNAQDALLILERYPESIHLLLTDMVLPKMSGIKLAERAKEIQKNIKVLFITGFSPEHINNQKLVQPQENLLEKPFSLRSLAQAVRKALDS